MNANLVKVENQLVKNLLIGLAKDRYQNETLTPCGSCKKLADGFTEDFQGGKSIIIFWFNVGPCTFNEVIKLSPKNKETKNGTANFYTG